MTTRGGNAQRREATRGELLRLGIERFPIKGYSHTSAEDIVAGSGFTKGAFYHYFPDKETFFVDVLRARQADRPEWWTIVRDPALTTLVEATLAALALIERHEPTGIPWLVIVGDFWERVRGRPEHEAALAHLYDGFVTEIANFVGELRARGFARSDLETRTLAAELLAVGEGYSVHAAVYGADRTGVLDAIVRILRP